MNHDELKKKFPDLVSRAKNQDKTAISELINLTQSSLFKFCFLLGRNKEQAQDLCQEVYIKAFSKLHQLQKSETFLSWLFQIAKNSFLDQKRSESLVNNFIQSESKNINSSSDQQEQWNAILTLQKILSQFDAEEKMILILIEIKGYTYQEVAETLKTTEDSIRLKIHRLRKKLQN